MSFLEALKTAYEEKRKGRTNYSLRAFARNLGVDPSLLSKVINEKRVPSAAFMKKVGLQLSMDENVWAEADSTSRKQKNNYSVLQKNYFQLLAEPIHFEILELAKTKGFSLDLKYISKRLKASEREVEKALSRLQSLGYLEENTSVSHSWVDLGQTELCKQVYQKKLLDKAKESIDKVPHSSRENYSLTVACSEKHVEVVKKKIKNFIRELDQFLEDQEDHEEVYQAVVSFYPVTNLNEKTNIGEDK